MSKYTTELRYILTSYLNNNNISYDNSYTDIINKSKIYLFNFDYPINQDYKNNFETAFCKHYYMREIGFETLEQFKLQLDESLNLLINKYNKLWDSENLIVDPLKQFIKDHTYSKNNEGTALTNNTIKNTGSVTNTLNNTNNTTVNNNDKNIYSETPQAILNDNLDYATTLTDVTTTGSNSTINNNTGNIINDLLNTSDNLLTNNLIEVLQENESITQDQAEALKNYRSTVILITKNLIEDLNDLFIGLY